VGKSAGRGIRRYLVSTLDSASRQRYVDRLKADLRNNNKGFYMDRTNSQATLSPCVRLFIELLLKEVGEVNSSECANSVSCRARRHGGTELDRSGMMLVGRRANSVLVVRHSVSR
jgi:hypothetical protein